MSNFTCIPPEGDLTGRRWHLQEATVHASLIWSYSVMAFRGDNNRPLKEWLQVFVASPQLRSRLYQTRVEQMWLETMGPLVQEYTRQIRLDGQSLIIRVESASLKSELLIMRETIRERVNERLGEPFIQEVTIL